MNYPFDIEIYKNFFSMICRNPHTNKDYVFYSFEDKDCRPQLRKFLSTKPTLIGYNSYSFDIPVLSYYLKHSLEDTYNFAQMIIKSGKFDKKSREYYDCRDRSGIDGIDLMRVLSLDGNGVSLKQCAITIKWPRIQELPIPYDSLIDKSQIKLLLDYNANDVGITNTLYLDSLGDIEVRRYILDEYGVNVFNKSESHTANELMTKLYSLESSIPEMVFMEARSPHKHLQVIDCIGKDIEFVSDDLCRFYENFKTMSFNVGDKKFECGFMYKKKRFNVKLGGLHTIDKPGIFKTNDKKLLIHVDVKSNYPAIMLKNHIKPAHLDDCIIDIFGKVVKDRLFAKDNGDYLKAAALKIVINSVFGKMNSDTYWLYDPSAFYSVTISGQLYLLSLIDLLETNDIDVISANTDGIISYIDRDKLDLYYELCNSWCRKTGMGVDYDIWDNYIRRDGNNYLAVESDGKIKQKGCFFDITDTKIPFGQRMRKTFKSPIVTKALHNHFINGISAEDTIRNHTSLYDFLITQKPGKKFDVYYGGEKVQRINRVYISNNGKRLYKSEDGGKNQLSIVADEVTLANDVIEDSIPKDLDYKYYINEVNKIIWKIQPPIEQRSLF